MNRYGKDFQKKRWKHCMRDLLRWKKISKKCKGERAMKQHYTRWWRDVDPKHVLEEYPRQLMKREKFMKLNGWLDYRITSRRSMERPGVYDGKILVPFSPESALCGVKRPVMPEETLWY